MKTTLSRMPAGVWALGVVSLLMDVSSEMIHALLPVWLVVGLGASALTVGLIEGAANATASIVKVFSGALSDALGRRKALTVLGYGLAAATKPVFALAGSVGVVAAARLADRVGKGIRGAPRDALMTDLAPQNIRGAAFGLRQSLDTVGAFLGPLVAIWLMWMWADDFRAVFWAATVPAVAAVVILLIFVREPERAGHAPVRAPLSRDQLARLPKRYWAVVALSVAFMLARFSEAFLVLRAEGAGLVLALVPLVYVGMNLVGALAAYPAGALSDRIGRQGLLAAGLLALIAADLALATAPAGLWGIGAGVLLWGLHLGLTEGLLATLVADTAPEALRGTAFGVFHFASGLALLGASALAGAAWSLAGPEATFAIGGGLALAALLGLAVLGRQLPR